MSKEAVRKKAVWVMIFLLLLSNAITGYFLFATDKEYEAHKRTTAEKIEKLESSLATSEGERNFLAEALRNEQDKNAQFDSQIKSIASTVGLLDKLAKTEEELLQKYSKVYFLNEHYIPAKLEQIPEEYVYENRKEQYLDSRVMPFFLEMMETAQNDGMELKVISGFRSFDEQTSLKWGYTVTYGAGTSNQFSADQGYSEHQLGSTLDFTTPATGDAFTRFKSTDEYAWLKENAHRFGFILSYPENNSFYQFEPWHWRFVGKALANKLREEDKHFYDLDQREINEYLISLFD